MDVNDSPRHDKLKMPHRKALTKIRMERKSADLAV